MTSSPERPTRPRPSSKAAPAPTALHPRNRHQGRYDLPQLAAAGR
ncbi:MAG: hypothetical protein ACOH1V_04865 [Stenotrophomonas sp.]